MEDADLTQHAETLLTQGHYREAAQVLLGITSDRARLLLIEALAAAGELKEAWALVESVDRHPGLDRLWPWIQDDERPKQLDLTKVSQETLTALMAWASGVTVKTGGHYSAGRALQIQVRLERYKRSLAAGDLARMRRIARVLAEDGWERGALSDAWLQAAWQATQVPEVLALLIRRLGREEDMASAVAYLGDQGERSAVLVPALIERAGILGREEQVRRLVATPGINWWPEDLTDDLVLFSTLLARILHPTPGQDVPEVGTRRPLTEALRWGLLRCVALQAGGRREEALAEIRILLEEHALHYLDPGAGSPDSPLVYGLTRVNLPDSNARETDVSLDADPIWVAYLGEVAQDPGLPARLRALAHLGITLNEQYDEEGNEVSGRDMHVAAALDLAEGPGELWAISLWPGSGDELADLERYSRALARLPGDDREGHTFLVRNTEWKSSSAQQALAYHRLLVELPAQLGLGNQVTHQSAFDADWRAGLERYKLHAEAVEACRTVLADDPGHASARFFLAYHLLDLTGSAALEEAREVLRTYLSKYPGVAGAWNNLAVACARLKRYAEAADAYERSAQLNPQGSGARWARASRERSLAEDIDTGLALIAEPDAPGNEIALGKAYWARQDGGWAQTAAEAGRAHGVRGTNVATRVRPFVRAVDPRVSCTRCGTLLTYSSRTDYTGHARSSYTCQACQEAERKTQRAEAERLTRRREELIRERYAYGEETDIDVSSLTLSQAVKLLALIRARATEDMRALRSEVEARREVALGASSPHSVDILRELYRANLIEPHPSSTVNAFEWEGEDDTGLILDRVRFTLSGRPALGFATVTRELAQALKGGPDSWPETWKAEQGVLWRELVHAEALANLEYQLRDHRLEPHLGEKTDETLRALVEDYSLGQIWNLIWQGVSSAASFKQKAARPTNDHAVNVATSTLRKRGEHYRAEGLGGPRPSKRDWNVPMPQVSQVFFIHALGLLEEAYITARAPL